MVESASRPCGPLFKARQEVADAERASFSSPLEPMNREERITADFRGTALTLGPHPLAQHRSRLDRQGVVPCSRLASLPDGTFVSVAGAVIDRQRPGTAKGFVFLSLEDETGISNAIITPDIFDQNRFTVVGGRFLLIEGTLQNQDNVISVKARRVEPLNIKVESAGSHD